MILTVGSKVHFKTITVVCCLGKFFIMLSKHCLQGLYFVDSMGNFTIISRCVSLQLPQVSILLVGCNSFHYM